MADGVLVITVVLVIIVLIVVLITLIGVVIFLAEPEGCSRCLRRMWQSISNTKLWNCLSPLRECFAKITQPTHLGKKDILHLPSHIILAKGGTLLEEIGKAVENSREIKSYQWLKKTLKSLPYKCHKIFFY